ncbi:MAG: G5 domain-containing protein [Chthonomonas sp.]|nr:G5 domain-containing protein [Chthonomonas sp.]
MRTSKLIAGILAGALLVGTGSAIFQELPENRVDTETVVKPIPVVTKYVFSRDIGKGRVVKTQEGVPGSITTTFKVIRDSEGKILKREEIETVRVEAVPIIMSMGKDGFKTDRGSFMGRKTMIVEATAYHPSAGLKNPTFKTRMGLPAKYGVIAVDPKVIPLGTHVFVEGYGFAYACDTGGAIKGKKIDVCIEDHAKVRQWGRRKVKIHILAR